MQPHVYVVDDHEPIRVLVARTLETEGYRVSAFAGGPPLLEAIARDVPDLIISDVMMPGMSGYELLERLRADARLLAVPVVFLSALGDATSVERGRKLGVDHYLVKPFTPKQLLATVSGTLKRYAELRRSKVIAVPVEAASVEHPVGFEASGVHPIDVQSGGLSREHAYVVTGTFEAAKTVLWIQAAHAALERGECVVLVSTQRLENILYVSRNAGLDLGPAVGDGRLYVLGLADRFEALVESRADVFSLTQDIVAAVNDAKARTLIVASALTILCANTRLQMTQHLVADFVVQLEAAGVRTLLTCDTPATEGESLAEAYLKRVTFGTVVVETDPDVVSLGRVRLEQMQGVAGPFTPQGFRIARGVGLAAADAASAPHVYDELAALRERFDLDSREMGGPSGMAPAAQGTFRLRDPFVQHLRDCLEVACRTSERCAVVMVRFGMSDIEAPSISAVSRAIEGALTPQDVVCWQHTSELVILSLGADAGHVEVLVSRLHDRLAVLASQNEARLTLFDQVTAARPEHGPTVAALLEVLAHGVASMVVPEEAHVAA